MNDNYPDEILEGAGLGLWQTIAKWSTGQMSDAAFADYLDSQFADVPPAVQMIKDRLRERNRFPTPGAFTAERGGVSYEDTLAAQSFRAIGLDEAAILESVEPETPVVDLLDNIEHASDRKIAESLRNQDTWQVDADDRYDDVIQAQLEAEICRRLGYGPEHTEQGLSIEAGDAVNRYLHKHAPEHPKTV